MRRELTRDLSYILKVFAICAYQLFWCGVPKTCRACVALKYFWENLSRETHHRRRRRRRADAGGCFFCDLFAIRWVTVKKISWSLISFKGAVFLSYILFLYLRSFRSDGSLMMSKNFFSVATACLCLKVEYVELLWISGLNFCKFEFHLFSQHKNFIV